MKVIIFSLSLILAVSGCGGAKPIQDGAKVPTPWQCIEAHKRGEVNC